MWHDLVWVLFDLLSHIHLSKVVHKVNKTKMLERGLAKDLCKAGLEIRGCWEPRAPLNTPAAPSNFCREPNDVLFAIHNTFMKAYENAIGLPGKNCNFEPCKVYQTVSKWRKLKLEVDRSDLRPVLWSGICESPK